MTAGDAVVARAGAPATLSWEPPGDKSISQRAALLASVSEGTCRIDGFLRSDDTASALGALRAAGIDVEDDGATVVVHGRGPRSYSPPRAPLDAGNSATSARLLLAITSAQRGRYVVDGNARLRRRPMGWVVSPLRALGARIEWASSAGALPARVDGGELTGREISVEVDSAQAVSALLFAGALARGPTTVRRRTRARDHTERLLRHFGVRVDEDEHTVRVHPGPIAAAGVRVAGDPSAAAAMIAAVAIRSAPGTRLTIPSVGLNRTRTGFLRALDAMGAAVDVSPHGEVSGEPVGSVTVTSGRPLTGVEIGGRAFVQSAIDELPLVAALAATASGDTVVRDAAELRDKDTDRIATTVALVRAFGADARATRDGFVVRPRALRSPGTYGVPGDHRIAMAALVLASALDEPTTIEGCDVVRVSFPGCVDALARVCALETRDAAVSAREGRA